MGAPGMVMQVVVRHSDEREEGQEIECYTIEPMDGDIPGLLVTRDSDEEARLICGRAMEELLARYKDNRDRRRLPEGRVWADARDPLDLLARAIVAFFDEEAFEGAYEEWEGRVFGDDGEDGDSPRLFVAGDVD